MFKHDLFSFLSYYDIEHSWLIVLDADDDLFLRLAVGKVLHCLNQPIPPGFAVHFNFYRGDCALRNMAREDGGPFGSLLGDMLAEMVFATKRSDVDTVLLNAVRSLVLASTWMLATPHGRLDSTRDLQLQHRQDTHATSVVVKYLVPALDCSNILNAASLARALESKTTANFPPVMELISAAWSAGEARLLTVASAPLAFTFYCNVSIQSCSRHAVQAYRII